MCLFLRQHLDFYTFFWGDVWQVHVHLQISLETDLLGEILRVCRTRSRPWRPEVVGWLRWAWRCVSLAAYVVSEVVFGAPKLPSQTISVLKPMVTWGPTLGHLHVFIIVIRFWRTQCTKAPDADAKVTEDEEISQEVVKNRDDLGPEEMEVS